MTKTETKSELRTETKSELRQVDELLHKNGYVDRYNSLHYEHGTKPGSFGWSISKKIWWYSPNSDSGIIREGSTAAELKSFLKEI